MSSTTQRAALGFSVHTGWASAIAVAGPLTAPKVLQRTRIDINPGKDSPHLFHAAAEMPPGDARRHIDASAKRATAKAMAEIASLQTALATAKAAPRIGVVTGNTPLPSSLDAILKSHMMIHSAEGDFYRRAILEAAAAANLKSAAVPSRELAAAAAAALKVPLGALPQWLKTYGATVGRPWGRDEKDAFLVACVALAQRG